MSLVFTIDGADRTSSIVFNSVQKTDNVNQQVDTLRFLVRKYGTLTYVPSVGDEVVVTDGATTVFGGVVVRIREKVKASKILEYNVECNDYSQFLKRELVTERYEAMTANAIIADILTNYASDFTDNNVDAGVEITSISFNRLTVAECLQKLANVLGYVWYVDYDKDIHFFAKNTEEAPFDLTDTSSNYIYDSLEITEDITQIKNSVLVQGGEQESTGTRTELLSGDGTITQFNLINKFSQLPVVVVGTTTQDVGVEYLDDDAGFDVMWNYNEKYLRFTTGNTPPSGTRNISVTAKYLFPIVVQVPSPASILEFGTYEFAITDKTIVSQDEAFRRALAELEAYKAQIYEGGFRCYLDGGTAFPRSGQVLNINSAQRGKNIDVLIQSVSMTMRDPLGERFEYEVRFATLRSIGIIEFLQQQIASKEIIVDDDEALLSLVPLTDSIGFSDTFSDATQSGPYLWGPTFSKVVISQVYGGGGNVGATYTNDFIEIHNSGTLDVDLTGWSVQYTSATGSTWIKTDLSGTIPAGGYRLIQEASSGANGSALPTPDFTGSIGMSTTTGKVALRTNQTLLSGANPLPDATIVDFVGYGATANAYEGSGPTATLSVSTAAIRAGAGCTDTDDNSADFSAATPTPRNSASAINLCSVANGGGASWDFATWE